MSVELIRQEKTLAHDRSDLEDTAEMVADGRDDLFGAARSANRIEPRPGADLHGWARSRYADIDQERTQVVVDECAALGPLAGKRSCIGERSAGSRHGPSVHRTELDPIIRGSDLPGQRRLSEPDVVQVDQAPTLGQPGADPLTDRRDSEKFGQQDVRELSLRRDPERQRGPEGDPASVTPRRPDQRETGRLDRTFERLAQLAPAKTRRRGGTSENEAPALAGGRRGRDGGGIGRCRPLGRRCWAAFHVW